MKPGYLSTHFTLVEMRAAAEAARRGIDNAPPVHVVRNMEDLCWFLEPVRAFAGPMHVTSGYRCPALNEAIGGSPTSKHPLGLAADLHPSDPEVGLRALMNWVQASPLTYDQLIYEYGEWVHIGIAEKRQRPRRETLMIFKPGKWLNYDPADPRVTA